MLRGTFGNNFTPPTIDIAANAVFKMKNGKLDIDNDGTYGGIIYRSGSQLVLEDTVLAVERFYGAGGLGDINRCTGHISDWFSFWGPVTIRDSSLLIASWCYVSGTFNITNSTVSFTSTCDVGVRTETLFDGAGVSYMREGSVVNIATRVWVAGQRAYTKTAPPCEFWVCGACVTNKGQTRLGGWSSDGFSNTGNGMFGMTAGSYRSTDLLIGCPVTGGVYPTRPDPDGYYFHTDGTATFSGAVTFYSNTNGLDGCGAMQFIVATNAVMTLTGAGMARAGNGPWVLNFNSETNFDTRGTFVFAPAPAVPAQKLLAFAEDKGEDKTMRTNHTAIGTLDLRELVAAGKTLDVVPAGNFATNAVYVRSLRMGKPAAPGAYFMASSNSPAARMNVYYDVQHSDIRGHYLFSDSNGELIPINVPCGPVIVFRGL